MQTVHLESIPKFTLINSDYTGCHNAISAYDEHGKVNANNMLASFADSP